MNNVAVDVKRYVEPVSWGYSVTTEQIRQFFSDFLDSKNIRGFIGVGMHCEVVKEKGIERPEIITFLTFEQRSDANMRNRDPEDLILSRMSNNSNEPSGQLKGILAPFARNSKLNFIACDGGKFDVPVNIYKILATLSGADFKRTEVVIMGVHPIEPGNYSIAFEKQLAPRKKGKVLDDAYIRAKKYARNGRM
jgi:hypothetical protein